MKIRSLTLKHIGVFEDETINFPEKKEKDKAEIHILTGQNGTGKTTILQALAGGMLKIEQYKTFPHNFEFATPSKTFEKILLKKFKSKVQNQTPITVNFSEYAWIKILNNFHYETYNIYTKYATIAHVGSGSKDELKELYKTKFARDLVKSVAFAYSGYRFIEDEENLNIKENEDYDPLENALEFNKTYNKNDYSLNQWLANTISKRNNAFFEGNEKEVERFKRNIENLKLIIQEIIETPIDFKFKNETSKIVAVKGGVELDFDLLPDGLRSIISWIGDLLMRMDALKWENDLPVFEREFILFLDEIEVHLHPSWQRKVLPVVQKLFKNAQIFITTHSPFIVNSIDGAYIYELKLDADGKCKVELPIGISDTSKPIDEVLNEVYDIEPTQMYGEPRTIEIEEFQKDVEKAYKKEADFDKKAFLSKAKKLAFRSTELRNNVQFELRQLSKSLAEDFSI
jgi:predicted ATP-binding protein involved in virulence